MNPTDPIQSWSEIEDVQLLTRLSYKRFADHFITHEAVLDAFDWSSIAAGDLVVLALDRPRHFNRLLDEFMLRLDGVSVPPFRLLTILINGQIPLDVARRVLGSSKISHWYTENWGWAFRDPKLTIVPIGVDIPFAQQWSQASFTPIEPKRARCLSTFQHGVPVIPRSGSPNDRLDCMQAWVGQRWVDWSPKVPIEEYVRLYGDHAFGVSPLGTRLDCHRTWEILACGAIPIVKRSTLLPLWREFPIVVVDDWSDVTAERLEAWHHELAPAFDASLLERLTEAYWLQRISGERKAPQRTFEGEADDDWAARSESEIIPRSDRVGRLLHRNPVLSFLRYVWVRVSTHRAVRFDLGGFFGDFDRLWRSTKRLVSRG